MEITPLLSRKTNANLTHVPQACLRHLCLYTPHHLLIINAFACKENGEVMAPGQQPSNIFAQKTNQVKLSATMDKKRLKPGRYLANIVAHNTTSRVVFVVEDPSGKPKIPSLKQVMEFLGQ
jgi:hypothetical protein